MEEKFCDEYLLLNFLAKYPFGMDYFCQIILLFSLFLLLFMGPTALFDTIYGSYCTISTKFYLYLQYFHAIIFQFQQNKRYPNAP